MLYEWLAADDGIFRLLNFLTFRTGAALVTAFLFSVIFGGWLIDFMREALRGKPDSVREQPGGLVTVRIDPETGALAAAGGPNAIFETFPADAVPSRVASGTGAQTGGTDAALSAGTKNVPEQLF